MIGFQQETEDDLVAIGRFLEKLTKETRLSLNVSINAFIPKPFSLWEAAAMDNEETLFHKVNIVKNSLPKYRSIDVTIAPVQKSILEAIISRADRGFSPVILDVFKASLNNRILASSWQLWAGAMQKNKVNFTAYLKPETKNFPWSFIDTGAAICNLQTNG